MRTLEQKPSRNATRISAVFATLWAMAYVGGPAAADDLVDQYLIPASDATLVQRAPGPLTTDPLTGAPVQLPFQNAFPLPDGPVGDPNKVYTICFSQAVDNNPWPFAMKGSMMLEEKRHPNVKVLYHNTHNDALRQIQDLQTCAAQNPSAIIVWPHSIKPLTPVIEELYKKGFIIVGIERKVATKDYTSWIFDDDVGEMRVVGAAAADFLGKKGTIGIITGDLGSSPQIIRTFGFKKTIGNYPDIKLVTAPPTDYSTGNAYQLAMQYLLSPEGKTVNAIFAESGSIAMGVVQALKQSKRTDIPIFTLDGSKTEIKTVANGDIKALIPHSPLMGDVALRVALYHVLGKETPKNIMLEPMELITPENAASMGQYGYGPEPK
jgi:galactofuranose transport system substrate-binding protein